jgi:hypothetical protein
MRVARLPCDQSGADDMPRKRRTPKARKHDLPVWQQEFLLTGQEPIEDEDLNPFEIIEWKCHSCQRPDPVQIAWSQYGEGLLQEFIEAYPGHRPYAWFAFESPEPRRRVAGVGDPKHEHLNYGPVFRFGIPVLWVSQREVDFYNGRARDVNGARIEKWGGGYYEEGHFKGAAIAINNPPQFESQAAFLDRLGLLSERERKALHADAFQPESLHEDTT